MPDWQWFVEQHWDPGVPVVWQKPLGRPIASGVELLAMLAAAGDRFRGGDTAGTLLCLEHASRTVDIGRHLVRADDRSLRAYAERVNQAFDKPFALIVHSLHAESFEHYRRVREFIAPLLDARDLSQAVLDTDVFLGSYRMTPQGVHVDAASNFAFVVEGTKRMLVWPPEAFADHRDIRQPRSEGGATFIDTLDLADYRESAVVLEGEPGDVLFWPESWWHVGEAVGEFSATWNLSVFRGRRRALIERRLRTDDNSPLRLDGDLADVARRIADSGPSLAEWLAEVSAEIDSASGFAAVPVPRAEVAMSVAMTVRVDDPRAIACRRTDTGFVVAVNGHAITLPSSARADELIDVMKQGPVKLRALIDRFEDVPVADARALVKAMLTARAATSV